MWKPDHYPSISPYLISENAQALVSFLETAFGGVLLRRFDHPDGTLMHAEIRIDDSVVMVGGGKMDPQRSATHIHLYVEDAQATFDRAVAAGAAIIQTLDRKRADDDLRGGVRDASGTIWWIATR